MQELIKFKNVKKTYNIGEKNFNALDGVDFTINKGEFVVILGPSGAGKSTLLNLLGGMDKTTSGEIIVGDKNITNYNDNELTDYRAENIGFIFQFYNILPTLTVLENVQLINDIVKNPKDAKQILKEVGLENHINKFPNQLSGGEQQRVSIIAGITGCSMLLVCAFGMLDSMNNFIDIQFEKLYNFEYKLSLKDGYTENQYNNIINEYGDYTSQSLGIEIANGDNKEANNIFVDNSSNYVRFLNHDGNYITLEDSGIYITEKLAKLKGYEIGDTIKWHIYGDNIIIGLPLGFYMTDFIFKMSLSDTYDFSATIRIISYLYAIVGTYIVSFAVSRLLARKVNKIDMVSSLKGNE